MREIEFRGLSRDGEWIYGGYYKEADYGFEYITIERFDTTVVQPGTISQFTGEYDIYNKRIYGGDILEVKINETTSENIFSDPSYKKGKSKYFTGNKIKSIWTVEYVQHSTYSGFKFYGLNRRFNVPMTRSRLFNASAKVVGSIHANPELLKH